MMTTPVIAWERDASRIAELVDLFMKNVDETYISYSEIQEGRADSDHHWSTALREKITMDLTVAINSGEGALSHRVAVACVDDAVIAFALLAFHRAPSGSFAVVEDLVVDRGMRSRGIGRAMIDWILQACRNEDMKRVFLESGIRNVAAHAFFEGTGFRPVATVFMREC
jgi:GNAT superfamily N-acetyltransferase